MTKTERFGSDIFCTNLQSSELKSTFDDSKFTFCRSLMNITKLELFFFAPKLKSDFKILASRFQVYLRVFDS